MWNLSFLKIVDQGRLLSNGLCGNCITRWIATCLRQSHASHGNGFFLLGGNQHFVTYIQSSSKPPLRILFFGSDDFAVESLKRLYAARDDTKAEVIDSLEVVTLSSDAPVRKYAEKHRLRIHQWPDVDLSAQFDVGVVVSFGCLIKEKIINRMSYGILNVHPSLLPRWRGPAPIFHTILQGDSVTGVTIMQIRPKRFDVGPILQQELYEIPKNCTADELGATLAVVGARLLMDTLRHLPERIANQKEQSKEGATFAPKISPRMAWIIWEEYSCDRIDRLCRAIGSRFPLKTMWMGSPVKLLDFVGKCSVFPAGPYLSAVPGSVLYQKESNALLVRCKDGWVGFKAVKFKKKLSAADFFNGYLHQSVLKKSSSPDTCFFQSYKERTLLPGGQDNTRLLQTKTSFHA